MGLVDDLETMTPKVPGAVYAGAVILVLAVAGVLTYGCVKGNRAARAQAIAEANYKAATKEMAQGVKYESQEKAQAAASQADSARVQADDSAVLAAQARVDRLRVGRPGRNPPASPSGNPDPSVPVPPSVDLAPMDEARDTLIRAQAQEISDLKAQVKDQAAQIETLHLEVSSFKAAAQDSAQEAVQLKAALAAKEGLIRAAELKGALYGGIAGFLGGRAKR